MRFWLEEKEGYPQAVTSSRVTQQYVFRVVYHAWRKVRFYEEIGEIDIARAQRIVLRDRARWAAKQREIARGWRLRMD